MEPVLERFVDELLRWNARINLTAARGRADVEQHVEDSRAVLGHIPEMTRRVIDVGSGGGFPGAVIAMLRPEIQVTALEPIHKKLAFLQQIRRTCAPNLVPLAERLEDHQGLGYDVATSRATFELSEWLAKGRVLVRPGGLVLGMEGIEQTDLPPGATRHPYAAGDRTRAIIVLQVE